MFRIGRLMAWWGLTAVLLIAGLGAAAQESLSGTISVGTPFEDYTLPMQAGETAFITVTATSPALDPVVQVFAPDDQLVAENDDIDTAGGNYNAAVEFTASVTGEHVIRVSSFGGSTGTYRITVTFVTAGSAGGPSQNAGETDTAEGQITDAQPVQSYTITLAAGEAVTMTAEALSGSLDPYLIVYDPSGRVLVENDDIDTSGGIYDSQVAFTAPVDGEYAIDVTRYDGEGEFRLTVVYGVFEAEQGTAVGSVSAEPVTTLTGTISDAAPEQRFAIDLFANETIFVTAEATSGDLDTLLTIVDAGQRVLAQNDDYNPQVSLNSALTFTSAAAGTYYFVVSRYEGAAGDSSGDFVLSVYRDAAADEAISAAGEPAGTLRDVTGTAEAALSLSGPTQIVETEHFRIFYTLDGDDATTPEYLEAVAQAFEEAFGAQRDALGFTPPPANNGRFDVYLYDVIGKEENALGYAQPEQIVGDNPNTPARETRAATSHLVIDNDYASAASSASEAIQIMRATVTHELNHLFQFGYDAEEPHNWFFEATASWIEVATFPTDEEASGYLQASMGYPEVCFGAGSGSPETNIMYGTWLYIQSLVEAHEPRIVSQLWEQIAERDGFSALETTLNRYGDTLVDSVLRYHLLNLMRRYDVAELLQYTVWLENIINQTGKWQPTGQGIQELGANYFELATLPGSYELRLTGPMSLRLYAIGILGDQAEIFDLGSGGTFDNRAYDAAYLMVFNTAFDDDVDQCVYARYDIDVRQSASPSSAAPMQTIDASNFVPPALNGA